MDTMNMEIGQTVIINNVKWVAVRKIGKKIMLLWNNKGEQMAYTEVVCQ